MGGEGENKWINIGNQNSATELCKDYTEIYGEASPANPAWGRMNDYYAEFKNVIYCCEATDVPKFEEPPVPITAKPTTAKPTKKPTSKPTSKPTCPPGFRIMCMGTICACSNGQI
jgi:hypothetical protein